MYNYSPIKKIYIKNFRNIGEAVLEFDKSPIISLIGENEAGKTSVVKAFSVCALHASPRDQKDYIRDGTSGFGSAIELADGTLITRMKTTTLNSYSVKRPDGTEFSTTKIDSGLPAAVQEVMGLIEEPETKEFLQVRTYENQLLFVVTPASTNYKVMYDALKVDQLTRAIKIGSKEVNGLKADIGANDNGIATLTDNLKAIRTFDMTPLLTIKSRLNKELAELERIQAVYNLVDTIETKKTQLGTLNKLFSPEVSEVNEVEASNIFNISRLVNKLDMLIDCQKQLNDIDTLESIDLTLYNKLGGIVEKSNSIGVLKARISGYVDIGKAEEIDIIQLEHLAKAANISSGIQRSRAILEKVEPTGASLIEQDQITVISRLYDISNRFERKAQLVNADKQITDYCIQMENYLKSLGAAVEMCPNCGESIVIDTEKYA